MHLLVGIVLALGIGVMATWIGLDRDRAMYPVVLMVIGLLYVLFAAIGGSPRALILDSVVAAAFLLAAAIGFRSSLWVVVVGLAAHGVMDSVHGRFIANPGVPAWWPAFCCSYDLVAAAYLAWLLYSRRVRARAS